MTEEASADQRVIPSGVLAVLIGAGILGFLALVLWANQEAIPPARKAVAPPTTVAAQPRPAPGLYVNPDSHAAEQVRQWNADGRQSDANALEKIAVQPTAVWLTGPPQDAASVVQSITSQTTKSGAIPVFVVYDLPDRDCGGFSSGGASSAQAYRDWIGQISVALANQTSIVIVEPDALAQIVTGCIGRDAAQERYALLRSAVDTLGAYSNVRVYLDAGNAGWVEDPRSMVQPLRQAGVADARGFSLNVSNFFTTEESEQYGDVISLELGGQHFVIDTSRNGNGPVAENDPQHWCDPPGRALGTTPTLLTGQQLVDAYLWVKQPGDSDGACRPGAPPAGQWWSDYALDLVRT